MKSRPLLLVLLAVCAWSQQPAARPRAGKPPILRASEIKAGMKATAWTVFEGNTPEAVPIEILGVLKNAWGPKQDIVLGKMGGRAQRTNVAGGMSGSPVFVDGKLMGAVSLRMSVFSPDSICGITPIELMLEINDFDETRPSGARTPGAPAQPRASIDVPQAFAQAADGGGLSLTPIDTPLVFSGFHESTLREFGGMLRQMGINAAQGGAGGAAVSAKLAPGWQTALQPGDAVSGVLVSGDVNISAMGTVTYNDGKRVLAFGHPFLSLGPVAMPMAKAEVVWTLASAFQPGKLGNATDVVGALRQDRHSGIMGVLGEQAEMIPCNLRVRSLDASNVVRKQKDLHFDVFVQQRWTPFLMMVTLFNAVQGLNDFAEESTYRISGSVDLDGGGKIALENMFSPTEMPMPVPMMMAFWYGDKFNRLFLNSVRTPKLKGVDLKLDLLPDRRIAAVESAFADSSEVTAGSELPVKVYLRPYRGGRIERQIKVKIPAGFPKGDHRILLSDADTLNRVQSIAGMNSRFIDIPQTVSLLNQERTNNKLYVSLVQGRPTVYLEDKTMPSLPPSVANVMQNGRSASRSYFTTPETADEQMALPFDIQIAGSYSLRIKVN